MTLLAASFAKEWLGTPFRQGASVKGVGADCVGLIEGIARDMGVGFPGRADAQFSLLTGAQSCLIPASQFALGCVILLAKTPQGVPEHCGLLIDQKRFIHAHWRAGTVENRFGDWFARRVTHTFTWPNPVAQSCACIPSLSS
jgi:NlpC/P60 family putative phage cell wall peptidase